MSSPTAPFVQPHGVSLLLGPELIHDEDVQVARRCAKDPALRQEVESKYGKIDALVNNAGATFDPVMQEKPGAPGLREAFDHTHSLIVTSIQVVVHQFAPLLLKPSHPRLLFVTSGLSSLETTSNAGGRIGSLASKPPPRGWPKPAAPSMIACHSSKTAMDMQMLEWARLPKEDDVRVFCISPRFLATGLGSVGAEAWKKMWAWDPSLGGGFIENVIEGKRDANAGMVINRGGIQPRQRRVGDVSFEELEMRCFQKGPRSS